MKTIAAAGGLALGSGCAGYSNHRLATGPGPEDLERIPWTHGPALVTGTATRRAWGVKSDGRLEVHCPGEPAFTAVVSAQELGFPFCPLGISAVEDSQDPRWVGKTLLYVANQLPRPCANGSEVEVFEVAKGTLRHLANLGPNLRITQPNGIAAFRDGSVYVSDLSPTLSKSFPRLTHVESTSKSGNTIARYQPPAAPRGAGSWTREVMDLPGANGMAPGPGERTLLACSYLRCSIFEFERDPKSGALVGTPREILKLPFHPDNLKRDAARDCYEVCGQKSVLPTVMNMLTGLQTSAGNSAEFQWHGSGNPAVHLRTYLHRGDWGAPSTAIRLGDRLYVAHIRSPWVHEVIIQTTD